MRRTSLFVTLSVAGAAIMIGACAGRLDLGERAEAGAPVEAVLDGSPPIPNEVIDAGDSGPTRCVSDCTPTTLTTVENAHALACGPDGLYVGASDGKLTSVSYATRASVQLPAAGGEIGYLAYDGGKLFYSLPALGEVHARTLATGDDERLAADEPEPQGVIAAGEDLFFVTRAALRRVARSGPDQTPSTRAAFADSGVDGPGVGLTILGTRFVVTKPSASVMTMYSANGAFLFYAGRMFYPTAIVAGATVVYYATGTNASIVADDILGNPVTASFLATNQFLPGGVCLHEGRLFFVTENEVRYLDVE